ncbi:MAG TPA: hypothetical protein VIX86_20595 [Streptosporangiaceae bacterium]
MTQDQLIILLFKIVIVTGFASICLFIAVYTYLAPWWRNEIGRTLVVKDVILALLLLPSVLSLFLDLNRFTSRVVAWVDVVLFAAMTPVMVWRTVVFARIRRRASGAATRHAASTGELGGPR